SEALGDRPAEALGVVLARHVDALEHLPDVPRHGRALLGIDVRDHHAGALLGEAPGVDLADPLPRARDDRDLALEPHVGPPLSEMAVSTARRHARASRRGTRAARAPQPGRARRGSGGRRRDVARTDRRWLLAVAALLVAWLGVFLGAGAIYRATWPHPRVSAFLRRVQHHAHGLLHLRGRRGSR